MIDNSFTLVRRSSSPVPNNQKDIGFIYWLQMHGSQVEYESSVRVGIGCAVFGCGSDNCTFGEACLVFACRGMQWRLNKPLPPCYRYCLAQVYRSMVPQTRNKQQISTVLRTNIDRELLASQLLEPLFDKVRGGPVSGKTKQGV